jgi:hypothetical protein
MTDSRQPVLEKLHSLIAASRANGGVVSTNALAKTLLTEFPECGFTPSELATLIAKEASKGGVAVSIDGPG